MDCCIEPYALEPKYTDEELAAAEMAEANQSQELENSSVRTASKLTEDVESWCSCGKCNKMIKIKECVCCGELTTLQPFLTSLQCFTGHEDFSADFVCSEEKFCFVD